MEFETNKSPTDDEARFQAITKRVVLQPVSSNVVPEPASGAELSDKLSETANQPNVSSDSEDTAVQCRQIDNHAVVMEAEESSHPKKRAVIGATVVVCMFAAAFLWVATQ